MAEKACALTVKGFEEFKEDLSKFIRKRKYLLKFYEENMKFRINISLNLEELKKFEGAVVRAYGKFSAYNSKKAAQLALKKWIQEK